MQPRIAFFLPALDGGGAEHVMVQLANAFDRRGICVEMALAKETGPRLGELNSGVRVMEFGGGGVIAALPALIRYLRRTPPLALLATLDHANIVACWGGLLSRTSSRIVVRQAMDRSGFPPADVSERVVDRLVGSSYRRADHVVVLAESMRETMLVAKRLDPKRVSVIPNPIASDRISELAQQQMDDPWLVGGQSHGRQAPLIVAAGRLQPQKDFPTLLRAVAKVARKTPVQLAVLGEGPDRANLVALSKQLGIQELVRFVGFQANPYPWFARADVVVLSSLAEGMPNVLLEAMVLGRPIVSTDCPSGPRELLDGGRLGKLVPVGDAAAFAAGILAVLDGDHPSEEELRGAVGALDIESIANAYLELLVPGRSFGGGA